MFIGNVEIKGQAALAPMAGVTDRAFRELCMKYGAAYCVGEMVSAKGVSMNDKKSKELMLLSLAERPAAIQIFGTSPETMAEAAQIAMEFSPQIIDINMGCPAPKIIKSGAGSALMKKPQLVKEITKAVVEAVAIPVTVKIRKGYDDSMVNAVDVAKYACEAGAAAITVHGRTRAQMYAPPVDLEIIAKVKEAVNIPVIGNGDVFDGESAKNMLNTTGCDLVMIGRGCLGRPWVFSEINAFLSNKSFTPPSIEERMEIMLSHIKTLCQYKGDRIGMNEARKHAVWYTKGIRNSSALRAELSLVKSLDELSALAEKIILNSNKE